ncbi:MAG: hypothetical protein DHS20C02_14440 [Micavibrio sp.]|nr:MAG: hypothetical protein DHS20C02_14440 [Micavibrio sp.]
MRHAFIFFTLLILLGLSKTGQAQSGHCENVKNTTDMMDCVNRHYEDAQERLNTVFGKMLEQREDETEEGLQIAQRSWLVYRDLQCGWEAAQVETKAVKRLTELSCLTDLTESRADVLASGLDEKGAQHKFSAYPRWMNVLAQENPDVYWRYGEHIRADLDCDGQDEQIMVGVDVTGNDKINTETGTASYKSDVILAVAENPVTGKPQTSLFRLPAGDTAGQGSICNPDVAIALVDHPAMSASKPDTNDNKNKNPGLSDTNTCRVALQIRDNQCEPLTLYWGGKDYQFNPIATDP